MTLQRLPALLVTAFALTVFATAASAQVPELILPDLSSAEGRERAAASMHSRLSAAVARAKSGEVIFARGPQGMSFVPIERRALRTYAAMQVQAGKLPASQAPMFEQRLIAEHPAVLAEVEATLARLAPALAAKQSGAPAAAAELCEFLKTGPADVTQMMGGECALTIGNPSRPEQFFTIGRPRDGRDACTVLRESFAQAKSGVQEVPGLGEFGFAGVSGDNRYGVAFCRNGVVFIGASDTTASSTVQQAMLARARAVDGRLTGVPVQTAGGRASSPCEPPNLGLSAGVVAAALTLRSGECVPGQLIDMGGADYTMRVGGAERRIALADAALIDFTVGGASGGSPPAGQHELVLRSGQRVTGRLYDLSGSGPLTVTFDTAAGRQTWSSTEIDRIMLLPVAGMTTPAPGGGAAGSVLGMWRGCDGRMVRFTEVAGEIVGHYAALGQLPPSLFSVGLQSHRLKATGPGRYEGFVEHRFFDGRRQWMPTSVTIQGDTYRDTGSDACSVAMTRVDANSAAIDPVTGGGVTATCAGLQGDWRRDDGMIIRVAPRGAGYQGFILNPGSMPQFVVGEQTLQVDGSVQQGVCTGQVLFKDAAGRPTWGPTRITMGQGDTFDTNNAGRWIRTTAAGQAGTPPGGLPPAGGVPTTPGAPTAPQAAVQAYANFAGEWNTINNGMRTVMRLQQQGNRVTGSYDYQEGLILGVVNGNTLTLTWTHAPANTYMGYGQFVLSADGRSFTGSWSAPTWGQQGTWTGTRR